MFKPIASACLSGQYCDELRSPLSSLAQAKNQKDEERDLGSDEDGVSFENARNAAATVFNKENSNFLQGHVPCLDVEEVEGGSSDLLKVVKTAFNTQILTIFALVKYL